MQREGDIIIRVTIIRDATIKVSIFETDRCAQRIDKTGEKVMSRGLKNPKPRREVTLVVIPIYFLALHELCFTLAYLEKRKIKSYFTTYHHY
jgi:hypothetical protein